MSGICGAWSMGHGDTDIRPILSHLERRGPDGTHHWSDEQVALGHTLLATTPEALIEKLPLSDPQSGCTITADARLDNRSKLITDLNLGDETRTIGDGELILRAYLRWAEDSPKHLLGDFAFAIWDPRSARLFCARDHIGMRQFTYYHRPGKFFAFATEAEALVLQGSVANRINEARIADVLDDLEGIDLTSTFFEEVFRLPPAHSLTIDVHGVLARRYWKLKAGPELKLESDAAYAAEFLRVFTEAVRCRLRSAGPVGSMLSGGLDSNSVAAVAACLLAAKGAVLQTFSAIGPDPALCIETHTIQVAAAIPGPMRHFVNHAELEEYQSELMRLWDGAVPFDSHMTLVRAVYLAANKSGVKVVLDGVAADFVLNPGNVIANMLRRGQLRGAWNEAQGQQRYWRGEQPAWKAFVVAVLSVVVPRPIRRLRRALREMMIEPRGENTLVSPALAERIGLKHRRRRYQQHGANNGLTNVEVRTCSILHPHHVAARERYDRVASSVGVEPRDPFLDIRFIEHCLTLPWTQLQADGWPKLILRRAMSHLLPAEVTWRQGKEHLGWAFTRSLFNRWPGWRDQLQDDHSLISEFAKLPTHRHGRKFRQGVSRMEMRIQLFSLLLWLRSASRKHRTGYKSFKKFSGPGGPGKCKNGHIPRRPL